MRRFAKSVTGKPVRGFESPSLRRRGRLRLAAAVALASVPLAGCVERTLVVRTVPPGADVVVDLKYVGRTPVEVPFTYGGVHEIILFREKDPPEAGGRAWRPVIVQFDTEDVIFDGPVFDYVVDLVPIPITDRKETEVELAPSNLGALVRGDQEGYLAALRERADVLRVRARETQLGARPRDDAPPAPASRPTP